jgi:dihydrofolate synthase/folylpolyglutamate synthase
VVVAIRTAECLRLSREQIEHGITSAVWPGRLERFPGRPAFLLDGAHNESATQALCETIREFYPNGVSMIFGCMADKDYDKMLELLRPRVRQMIFTKVPGSRSKSPTELQAMWPGAHATDSPGEAIAFARANSKPDETIVVCGSLYLIGEVRSLLQSEDHGGIW